MCVFFTVRLNHLDLFSYIGLLDSIRCKMKENEEKKKCCALRKKKPAEIEGRVAIPFVTPPFQIGETFQNGRRV